METMLSETKQVKTAQAKAEEVLSRMTLDEKIGQCLTLVWRGPLVTPSAVEMITRLNVGGFRIEPIFAESAFRSYYKHKTFEENYKPTSDYFKIAETYFNPSDVPYRITAVEYAKRLNRLKTIAMNRRLGIPLHICTDFENDYSHDYPFDGINIYPTNMGITATGKPEYAYDVGHAVAAQLSAIGINMLHSPVCDVNNNPNNPEIYTRAFSDDPDVVGTYVEQFWRGLEEGGLIATAKHYPGRGNSDQDAHEDLPFNNQPRDVLDRIELAPFKRLVDCGLRAIMTAHTAYPALDASNLPATLSSKTLIDILRGELGYEGVITSDAMGMGAVAKKHGVSKGCAMALKAGCNLVLPKFEGELRSQVYFEIKNWVNEGLLTVDELDDRVLRTLKMKFDQGLFENGGLVDAEAAGSGIRDPKNRRVNDHVSREAVMVLRDRAGLLPLSGEKKALIVEQVISRPELVAHDANLHHLMFNEAVLDKTLNVVNMTTRFCATEEESARIVALAKEVDVVVLTNHFTRYEIVNNAALVRKLVGLKIPLVVVTNSPYPAGAVPEAGTVICTFGATKPCMKAAADVLYGDLKATGKWPLVISKKPE